LLLFITNKLITKIGDNFSLIDVHFSSCRKAYFSLIYCCPLNAKIIVATQALIVRGAKIDAQDNYGETVFYYAKQSNNPELMSWLDEHYSAFKTGLLNQ